MNVEYLYAYTCADSLQNLLFPILRKPVERNKVF